MSDKVLPFEIKVKTAVDADGLAANISANLALMKDKVLKRAVLPHEGHAVICAAGPSLKQHLDSIKALQACGAQIVCIKHALPTLVAAGITPDYCVMLEARPVDGLSTHGIKRSDLFENAPYETKYLVASMSSPTLTKLLQDRGLDVTMWHTNIDGLNRFPEIVKNFPIIQGGTSSATRALFMFHTMGFRKFSMIGFDSSINPEDIVGKEKDLLDGKPKYITINLKVPVSLLDQNLLKNFIGHLTEFSQKAQVNGTTSFTKPFITTGELAAQLQDLESIYKLMVPHVHIEWFPGGAGKYVWDLLVEQNGMKKMSDEAMDVGSADFFQAATS